MTERNEPATTESVELAAGLRRSMAPLAVLLATALALAAPVVFLAFGLYELRHQASTTAHRVSRVIEREVRQDHRLWRYNVPKLLGHLRAYEAHPEVAAVAVVDADGRLVESVGPASAETLADLGGLWAVSPIVADGQPLGQVWVAMVTGRVFRDALIVLGLFAALGLVLGWLTYQLPVRAASRAEGMIGGLVGRLRASRAELAEMNEALERRVEERSAELTAAYAELQSKEARLRKIAEQAIKLQERERRAIARELHDAVGQALTAVRINLQLIEGARDGGAQARTVVSKTVALVDEALEEVRRAVALLGPAILDEITLTEAVTRQCVDFGERTDIAVQAAIQPQDDALSPAVESTCYRAVQEGLTNVARHARAAQVTVTLERRDGSLVLEIEDDGQGMDGATAASAGHGLAGIRERATMLGGQVEVDSRPGRGTVLRVSLPIAAAETESHDPAAV